jgi:hypothetical protein
MARTAPTILLEDIDDFTGKALQVCDADAVYAVTYCGKPITIRTYQNIEISYPGPKYAKSTYTQSGHAFNLAEKLNKQFNTMDFKVVIMQPGRVISEK